MVWKTVGPAVMTSLLMVGLCANACVYKRSLVRLELVTLQETLKEGDRVQVVTKDGEEKQLTLVEVRQDTLIGANEEILISDIVTVARMERHYDAEATKELWGQEEEEPEDPESAQKGAVIALGAMAAMMLLFAVFMASGSWGAT